MPPELNYPPGAWETTAAVLLAECGMTYEPEGNGQGERCVVRLKASGQAVADDYLFPCEGARSRLELAWSILAPEQAADWKTVELLRTLRQALREWSVQQMPIELPSTGIYLRGSAYWLCQRTNGVRQFVNLDTTDYAEAVKRAASTSEADVQRFLDNAREYDRQHHGEARF